jgi:hypothetical protein
MVELSDRLPTGSEMRRCTLPAITLVGGGGQGVLRLVWTEGTRAPIEIPYEKIGEIDFRSLLDPKHEIVGPLDT